MSDQSQTCPSCRSSKYSNPQLKLMVNVCGHSLCENCVEVLFVRGSGLCGQCKTPIRKTNFRYQLFEDPLVQKEIDIRKKVLSDFNKREDDFDCLEDYDSYLEKIEEIVYNLTNDQNVEETKRYIENYKKENKDIIKKNRTRPSLSLAFYDSELERESILREKREQEEEEEESQPKGLQKACTPEDSSSLITTGSKGEKRREMVPPTPRTNMLNTPSSTVGRRPPTTFIPPSVYAPPSFIVPPTQTSGYAPSSAFPVRPLPTPVSGVMAPPTVFPVAPPTGSSTSNWIRGSHHTVHFPVTPSGRKHQDTVLIPSTTQIAKNQAAETNRFLYEPYQVELCGPAPPLSTNQHIRWLDVLQMYVKTIIANLPRQVKTSVYIPEIKPKVEGGNGGEDFNVETCDVKSLCKLETGFLDGQLKTEYNSEEDNNHVDVKPKTVQKIDNFIGETKPSGLSHQLNAGACGISPSVFIERCLLESRCGLFI